MATQDSAHSRLPFEIKCLILQQVDIEDLRRVSLIWPEMLPFIRCRTFDAVVIGQSMNPGYTPDRLQQHLRTSVEKLHSVLDTTPDIHPHIHVLRLQEPKCTTGIPPPFPISRIPILPKFFGHISEMRNLTELVLERINFWMLQDSKALTRALRRASFRLTTLRLISCPMPLDILMAILRAVVDVEILELGTLRFGQFGISGGIDCQYHADFPLPLIDFDDPSMWKDQRNPPETEFLCADSFQMHITSDSDHRFVDLLSSERYSLLCDVRVLQINKMSGGHNLIRRLNKLLARMSQYLEELIIHSAEGYIFTHHPLVRDDSVLRLEHISTFRFTMVVKFEFEPNFPARWELDSSVLELYTRSLRTISKASRLRHLEMNLVIHIFTTERMLPVEWYVWRALDDALTTDALQDILESVALNVFVMPKFLFVDGYLTEKFLMDVENWILGGERLTATRMAYFGADQRGSISCTEVPDDCL